MVTYVQYSINETDDFDEHHYPRVVEEIDRLQGSLCEINSINKARIIISLLKDHCIKTEWLDGNKQLTWMLTSGFLTTSHLQSLFSSCKRNPNFTSGLEAYITTRLA